MPATLLDGNKLAAQIKDEIAVATRAPAAQGLRPALAARLVGRDAAAATYVGRSDIVGKPVAMLLTNANATVTICHSRTRDLPPVCRRADILVAAIGKAGMITKDFVRPGATVIDVGINRVTDAAEFKKFFAG